MGGFLGMQEHQHSSTYAQLYLPALRAYQEEMLQRVQMLVDIDSGTGQVEGVNRIIMHLTQWLQELDFAVSLRDMPGYGYNLVARRRGSGGARIMLVGHVDTVYAPGSVAQRPFSVHEELAYGPGVIDMKSGVVMGVYALRALLEAGFEQFGELLVVFNNDEEVGSPESGPLLRELAREVEIGLVLEASRSPEVVTRARKGADKYLLEIVGVPAHAGSEPHRGRSAVVELAHKILAIHNMNTLFYGVTCNVTQLRSSEPLNVVPGEASCRISIRAHDERSLNQAAVALEKIAASTIVPDTHTTLTRMPGRRPYPPTPAVQYLVAQAQAEGEALGLHIRAEGKGGVSDANLLMEVGVPTLDSLGPAGGGMHNLNLEYLRVDSLPLRAALLAGLLHRLNLSKFTGAEPYV